MTRQVLQNGETHGIIRGKINANFLEVYNSMLTSADVLLKTNNTPYTPINPYNPATKLYADSVVTGFKSMYDPNFIERDVFNRENHYGDISSENVIQDSNHRFASDTEKSIWNAKEPAIGTKNSAFNKNFGSNADTVSEGNHLHTGVYEPFNPSLASHVGTTSGNPHHVTSAEITKTGGGTVQDHINDSSNPHVVNAAQIGAATTVQLTAHIDNISNPHSVTKTQVGLSLVDNTSDINKPVSTATQTALNLKRDKTDNEFSNLKAGDVDGGNYFEISTTGKVKAYGGSRFRKTVTIKANGAELHPTQSPQYINYKGSRVLSFSASANQTLYFQAKIPYDYEPGTDIEFYVYAVFLSSTTGVRRYTLTHSWANDQAIFPTETSVVKDFSAVQAADYNISGSFGNISGTGKQPRSILLCSLTRNGDDAADTEPGATIVVFMNFSYTANSLGEQVLP